jgi:hypothetical protein
MKCPQPVVVIKAKRNIGKTMAFLRQIDICVTNNEGEFVFCRNNKISTDEFKTDFNVFFHPDNKRNKHVTNMICIGSKVYRLVLEENVKETDLEEVVEKK